MQTDVMNSQQKKVGQIDLNAKVFGEKELPYLWHELVKWQLARKRQGTAKTKQRNEVSGSTRKIYKQKHTGRARHGSVKAPIFVGGGQTFGPIPRSYDYVIPKQMKKKALCSALSSKNNRSLFKVVDELKLSAAKTKEADKLLKTFAFESALVIDNKNEALHRAVRNLPKFKYLEPAGLNVYDLMKFDGVIITKSALTTIQENLA